MQVESRLCGILCKEMKLPRDRVWIQSANRKIPDDDGIYITVGMISATPLSSNKWFNYETDMEEQVVTLNGVFQVNVFSRNTDAMSRSWEIVAAMGSSASIQTMEEYQFRVHRISSPIANTSITEGSSQIFRYSITVFATWANWKDSNVDFYTKFSVEGGEEHDPREWHLEWGQEKPE